MTNLLQRLRPLWVYILLVHLAALSLMSLFRLLFYWVNLSNETFHAPIAPAFWRGLWFDNVIACYAALPLCLLLLLYGLVGNRPARWLRGANLYVGVVYAAILMCEAANIPYFKYFTKVLNSSIWEWKSYVQQTVGMIVEESSWHIYIALYLAVVGLMGFGLYRLRRALMGHYPPTYQKGVIPRLFTLSFSLPVLALCLLGARGRLGYNPIKISAAYYCNETALNQMGVNPAFSLLTSTLDDMRPENKVLHVMNPEIAIRQVQTYLGRKGDAESPLGHEVINNSTGKAIAHPKNVVFIIMESMSAALMSHFGNPDQLTPYLDSLFQNSLSFDRIYSAGNHTNQGLFGTLYSYPSILKRNAMKGTVIPRVEGLPNWLQAHGYQTLFFMAHEGQYDNMNAFFRTNGFDRVYAQENYPRAKVVNHFGVSDNFLFAYALDKFNEAARRHRPFFGAIMTMSNHPPYVIPRTFHPTHSDPEKGIVQYADACVRDFMTAAQKTAWYKETLFVFLGDHGKKVGHSPYEVAESYNHIPLIIVGSGMPPTIRHDFGGQIDVAPTVLGLLGANYRSQHFGIDLLREKRPAMFYSADEVICARNDSSLFIYNPTANHTFCYDISTPAFRPMPFSARFAPLKKYAFSNLQAAERLIGRDRRP